MDRLAPDREGPLAAGGPSGYTALTKAAAGEVRRPAARRHQDAARAGRRSSSYTVDQIGNGAKSLLDEVATGKVTGEEETWSHTDLWDFPANVDGARVALRGPAAGARRPRTRSSRSRSTQRFEGLQAMLDRTGSATTASSPTTQLSTEAQVKELSDAVNALSEPLSQLTAAVTL